MPPIPTAKRQSPSAKGNPREARITGTGTQAAGSDSPAGSSAASRPKAPGRPSQRALLKDRVERLYMMMGTILTPLGRFWPACEPVGNNLKTFSTEATDAWMELADEDPKVKSYLESITGASTWGNVIGVHFAIFSAAIPNGRVTSLFSPTSGSYDPIAAARSAGLSEEDIAAAIRLGEQMGGGPGDTIRSDRPPAEAKPNGPVRSGIVDPATLGVTETGQEHSSPIPTDSGPIKGA